MRLDRWIMKHVCSNWNASQKLIAAKQVWVMSPTTTVDAHRGSVMIPRFRPACQGKTQLRPKDFVYFPKAMSPVPKRRETTKPGQEPPGWLVERVIYKDTDFLAIDKPVGWSVTPGKHVGGMHLQRLLPSLQFGMEEPPRFVHRLSTELTGVLLLARHRAAASYAKDMVTQRAFWQRAFWGVVCGRTPKSGTVSMPLAEERRGQRGSVSKPAREDDGGLPALTEYTTLRYSPLGGGISLLEMNPYSGRHHQARAHCAFGLRAPLIGDPVYYELSNHLASETDFRVRYHSEDAKRERQAVLGAQPRMHLHSRQLMIKTFAGKEVLITAPLPPYMRATFDTLGWAGFLRRADRDAAAQAAWSSEEDPHIVEALGKARAEARQRTEETEEEAPSESNPQAAREESLNVRSEVLSRSAAELDASRLAAEVEALQDSSEEVSSGGGRRSKKR
eukprot:TRINITY_DN39890_c0_g1_i2.p1 TRINITY_DN39890_c0_g1~~TRINITY_DN39890_c0_g1_i2.p1  ORF type:complete len:447 (-),score=83.16 TRINITY_DN39890_c0_g1_i2:5-1345(-)